MRIATFILSTLLTLAAIYALDRKWGSIPPIGRFLSPQQGLWQNAEAADADLNETIVIPGLKGKVNVYLDEALVPHVFADNDRDVYYVQGYLHAKYRLWQMETQTYLAAGRLSEVFGKRFLAVDREQRRQGMVFAAENALKEMEGDPATKESNDAYTAGVNAYIESLTDATLPLEYKLLDYRPEPWSNLKIALFVKQMSKTLGNYGPDLQFSNTKEVFSYEDLLTLEPQVHDSLVPIIPKGTAFAPPSIVPVPPPSADSLYFNKKDTVSVTPYTYQDPNNGSNNWAVNGTKTASGAPILCNDPHLDLTLPSIWFEMQLTTPSFSAYGVTFPGAPNVVIGFNNNIAWGITNSQRDVKDFYEIEFRDRSRREYRYNGQWEKTNFKVETIRTADSAALIDSVAYTVFGPVMYDEGFAHALAPNKAIAIRWAAHDPSNEGQTFYKLNRAKNYDDYLEAIRSFRCPGQNFLFASTSGDIALWQQARFPARWPGQGMYLMPGTDSSYAWQGYIPMEENPHVINPTSGFIQSANQRPVDSTYPYFIPGGYITARGQAIDRILSGMQNITPEQMMQLQNNNYHIFANAALPLLLSNVNREALDEDAKRYLQMAEQWNRYADASSTGTTVFQTWFDSLEKALYADEWERDSLKIGYPAEQTSLEVLLRDSAFRFIDDVNTEGKDSLPQLVTSALLKASAQLKKEESAGTLAWAKHKDPILLHLLRESVLPFARKVEVGGWSNVINAFTRTHGGSWRMVVHLTNEVEAWGIYPGGQSGNPGSRFYDNFVDDWAAGRYHRIWFMKPSQSKDQRIIATLQFKNS